MGGRSRPDCGYERQSTGVLARQKTLTLDFHGRCSLASAKNFQLEAELECLELVGERADSRAQAEGDAGRVVLLFGKASVST